MIENINIKINNALQLHQSGNLPEAEKLYLEILAQAPNEGNVLNLLGFLKVQNNQFSEAVTYLKKAAELYPNFFEAWFNLALALKGLNDFDNAITAYKKAIEVEPENVTTYFNLANVYECKNDTLKAIECYEKAYKYNNDKNDADMSYFLGVCYIKAKNFERGLPLHEYRASKPFAIQCQSVIYPQMSAKPLWEGTPMPDKTIFVYYESALGDTLQYVRYLDCFKGMFKKVLFKPQLCFIDFFKENNFGAEIIDSKTLPENLDFDVHIPLMSIPCVLKHFNEKDIPLSEGYLKANFEKTKAFEEKYFNNEKLKIGFKWMGNTVYDMTRVINIESFYKLFELPNTQFYSLQKGDGEEEFKKIPEKYGVIDLKDEFNDFGDTAAAVENLDLVICNDTSVAHLAAAMGKPTWILLPFVQNWRWHTDISYSPWYKSVKLFKQSEPDNWDEVFKRVYDELRVKGKG